MRKLKVAWVISPLIARGGGYNIVRGWIRHLPENEFDLTLAYFSHERARVEAAFGDAPSVRLTHLEAFRSPAALCLPAIAALRSLFARERPDVVHTVMVQGDILGSLAARLAGVPVVVSSAIGRLIPRQIAPWKAAAYRAGVRLARSRIDRVLAISGETKRELVEVFGFRPAQVEVLYCGIEPGAPPAPRPRPRADRPVIGTLGELISEKGVQHLLRAVPAILAAVPGARFRIVGDGGYRAALEELAGSLGVRDRVEFAGWAADGRAALADLDVLVFPSEPGYDGLPRVLLEAWAVGTPFVTSNVAAVPEIITDAVTGLVVPPGDPVAIATAVGRLLRQPDLWRSLREAGIARAAEFSVQHEVAILQGVYSELSRRAAAPGT
jgi:glycosyltransferase involved in cell wall biosynthesis